MRILGMTRADDASEAGAPPTPELVEKMGALIEEATKAGVILDANGLTPSAAGKRVSYADNKISVIDGPFTESKELVASYALFQVSDWDEALYWTKRFLEVIGNGEVELRPIFDPTDLPQEIFSAEAAAQDAEVRQEMKRNVER